MSDGHLNLTTDEPAAQTGYGLERGILGLLPIDPADWQVLKQQGFVAAEYRHGRGPYFKLRYRINGRQRVVYLGTNVQLADEIRQELAQLQAGRRGERKLARLTDEAHDVLRKSKQRLEEELRRLGLKFHGYAIRRSRDHLTTTAAQDVPAGSSVREPNSREEKNDDI